MSRDPMPSAGERPADVGPPTTAGPPATPAAPLPVPTVLSAGIAMGVAGDALLRAPGGPGLNFALLLAGVALAVTAVARARGGRISTEAALWLAVGVVFGGALMWRGSGLVRFLTFVAACSAFALPALRAGRAWLRSGSILDVIEAPVAAGMHAALGAARLAHPDRWAHHRTDEVRGTATRVTRAVLGGLLLAGIPLGVFAALFASADPVFAERLSNWVRVDLGAFASHVALTGVLAWLSCGYLAGFATGTRLDMIPRPRAPGLGIATAAVAVGLVDLLFLAFVQVQVQALFGGAAFVEATPGLSYATYAREGFFQLVTATALGLSWLLVVDGLLGRREPVAAWTFRALASVQLLLLLAIAASAVQRLGAYVDAYGITEDRFVAVAALGWFAVLIVGFAATVLRERRQAFVVLGLVSAFVWVAGLQVANPAARSAEDLLDRHRVSLASGPAADASPEDPAAGLDAGYLAALGSDAVPIVVERFAELPAQARCIVARSLLHEWGTERAADWRSWNASEARARRVVRDVEARLLADAPARGETRCSPPEEAASDGTQAADGANGPQADARPPAAGESTGG